MNAREVAQRLNVDPTSVRRWRARGCPVVRVGGKGRGHATQFDLEQVKQWRGEGNGTVGLTPEDVLLKIADALLASLELDHCDIRAGITKGDAAALLLCAFESCERTFKRPFGVYERPKAIRALNAHFVK